MIDHLIRDVMHQLQQPRQDIEKNLKALLESWISQQNLVTRDELERQQIALHNAQQQLHQLQKRLDHLLSTTPMPHQAAHMTSLPEPHLAAELNSAPPQAKTDY